VSALAAAYDRLLAGLAAVAAWLLLAMVGLISLNVTLRSLGWGVIAWSDEVSEYAVYAITLLAAPWLLRLGQHVRVDIAIRSIPPAAGWALELLADAIGVAIALVLTWYAARAVLESAHTGSITVKTLVFPEWWVLAPLPLCFLLLAVEFGLRLRRLAAGPRAPRASAGGGLA
jgi:TRAP-type C4-dicarboxylate transport system permease small subunit